MLAAALVARPNKIQLRYVLKRELLWDPCLDVVGRRLPNAFIARGAARKGPEIAAIAELARGLGAGSAALIYPEGTRFTPARRARAVAKLAERAHDREGAELSAIASGLRAVLPPRLGGALALMSAAPRADVVLLEHTGFEGAVTFGDFWRGALVGRTIRVRLRRFPASEISRRDRGRWLFERWAEMDAWICRALAAEGRSP